MHRIIQLFNAVVTSCAPPMRRVLQQLSSARIPAAAAVIALSSLSMDVAAANVFGPPGVQPASIGGGSGAPYAATTADFNNDGYRDVAVVKNSNNNTGGLAIYTANAIGTLTLAHDYGIFNLVNPNGITAADVNGDGKMDLVVTDELGVSILLGVGDGSFVAASPQRPALADLVYGAGRAFVADINHDGKPDIVVAVYGDQGTYPEVLLGIGGGKFLFGAQYPAISSVSDIALAKVNADAELDIVIFTFNTVSVMNGIGNGQFQAPVQVLDVNNNVYLIGTGDVADLDGDGKNDLVMANMHGKGMWYAKGNGDGSFQTPIQLYATGKSAGAPVDIGRTVIADVSGDGLLDVISDGYVLLQQPNHSFVLNQHIGYSETRMLTSLDLNGDGRPEVITRGPGLSDIAIFLTQTGPATTVITSGSPQSTVFGTAFANPLSVTVKDASNFPVPNLQVIFSASGGGVASATAFVALTNVQGKVSYTPVANNGLGCYTMQAVIQGVKPGSPEIFNLCNTGANDLTVTPSSDNQSTLVSTAFGTQLQVKLTASNVPLAGVTVSFAVPNSGPKAVLSATTAVTDAAGLAAVTATANAVSGSYSVLVSASGATPTSIKLSNAAAAGSAASLYVASSTPEHTDVFTPFPAPITIHVSDSNGNPVAGASVAYQITPDAATGASATFSALTAVTNASGDAQVSATANGFVGQYAVKVSVPTSVAVSPKTFLLRNIADLPRFMALAGGTPQSTLVNTAFTQKLRVKITNTSGIVTPQARVYFVATTGTTLSAVSALADANGFAEVSATADGTVGSYQVTAIVYDTSSEDPISQVFDLTNVAVPVVTNGVQSIPTLSEWALALLGLLIAAIGMMQRTRQVS